jgi:parallel beta-helix repeat protein
MISYDEELVSYDNTVIGNNISNNGKDGIYIYSDDITFSGNVCNRNGEEGIWVTGDRNTISNNIIKENGYNGILCEGNNNIMNGNVCDGNSRDADNTYSNIVVDNPGDYNVVQNNLCRKGTSSIQPKYGMFINSSTCVGTMVTNNDFYDSGKTRNFFDAGTDTKTTATNRTS